MPTVQETIALITAEVNRLLQSAPSGPDDLVTRWVVIDQTIGRLLALTTGGTLDPTDVTGRVGASASLGGSAGGIADTEAATLLQISGQAAVPEGAEQFLRDEDTGELIPTSEAESVTTFTESEIAQVRAAIDDLTDQAERYADQYKNATGLDIEAVARQAADSSNYAVPGVDPRAALEAELEIGALMGMFQGEPTLAGRQFEFFVDQAMAQLTGFLPDGTSTLDRLAVLSELTGWMMSDDGPIRTLAGSQYDELVRAARVSEMMQLAGLTGYLDGQRTVAGLTLDEAIRSNEARETLSALGQLETARANRASEQLAREGNTIQAIGEILANRAELGRLTFAESVTKRENIVAAFEQRRLEIAQAAPYAVRPEDVRVSADGNLETTLPLAGSIAGALQAAGLSNVDENFGVVPVYNTNPDAIGQAVMDSSAFNSPLPQFTQAITESQDALQQLLAQPIGPDVDTSPALTQFLTGV